MKNNLYPLLEVRKMNKVGLCVSWSLKSLLIEFILSYFENIDLDFAINFDVTVGT